MQDDILSVKVGLEGPTQAASFKLFFQETVGISSGSSTSRLATAFVEAVNGPLRDVLSNEWFFRDVVVRKHAIGEGTPFYRSASITLDDTVGTNDSPAVPANNALIVNLQQTRFGARHDGRIFIPGLPEDNVAGGIIGTTFASTNIAALLTAIGSNLQDSPDTGVFNVGVINQAILNAAPPAKDWEGAFSFVTGLSHSPILGIQKRRTTKTRGVIQTQ